jgi:UDP-N-acetylglucosamine--dolichyl-phosphate N-acetylglucosaminephosphotransferase
MRALEVLAVAATLAPACYFGAHIADTNIQKQLLFSLASSVCCFLVTKWLVPNIAQYLSRKGLKGRDMGRRGTPSETTEIPSAVGIVCGVVFLVFIIGTQLVRASHMRNMELLANYNAALLSICFMTLLGFADDVLDLPWRYKLILPTVASLPLLAMYRGVTTVLIPKPVRQLLVDSESLTLAPLGWLIEATGLISVDVASKGAVVNLGLCYLLYMGLLAVFATNAINIYAGINGLEAGQTVVIGAAILTANLYELSMGAVEASPHLFSALLALPFLATSVGVMWFNTYPAAVFVGDTFCYFAGMTIAVMAILGHFSKTLLLFFVPQIFNFIYSLPQLFKIYECPRHRLPQYDATIDAMRPSTFAVTLSKGQEAKSGDKAASRLRGGAADDNGKPVVVHYANMTLINLVLRITGPLHERTLTNVLLLIQVVSCGLGLVLRYKVSQIFY